MLLTVVALALFSRNRFPLETSSLMVLMLLVLGFHFFPYYDNGVKLESMSFFVGFGHEALIAVCALMIMGQGLVRTGALEPLGRFLSRYWSRWPKLSLFGTLVMAGMLSGFVNNTPIVVLILPVLATVAAKSNTSASSMLLPVGLATLVGGMSTTIGTSTNLLVVSVASDLGVEPFGLFDFFMLATLAGAFAYLYLWLIAPLLLADRKPAMSDFSPRVFMAQLKVPEYEDGTPPSLSDIIAMTEGELVVRGVKRGDHTLIPFPDMALRSGDLLVVRDTPNRLKEFERSTQLVLYSDGLQVGDENPLSEKEQQMAEIVIVEGSPLVGRRASVINRARNIDMTFVALHRAGPSPDVRKSKLGNIRLAVGDILLVQASRDELKRLKTDENLLVLDASTDIPTTSKAPLALGIMAAVILSAAVGLIPIAEAAMVGSLAMLLTNVLVWREVTQALSVQVVMIVVVSLALGLALTTTGATQWLADGYLRMMEGSSPRLVLAGLITMMAVLTNIVSNNAAAVIGTPIAISIASSLGLAPQPFILAVLFGANMSYATPMAYKTNLLVMNAGGYQFSDFVKVGVPLMIMMVLILSWMLPMFYGF
ncbi:MAG: SLC13 family permease [Gammaproteobacteria bacterium]|nr:SLC13 family permease [Gammaproteobacteria bacterium]